MAYSFDDNPPSQGGDDPYSRNHGGNDWGGAGGGEGSRPFLALAAGGALLGAIFSTVSTSDFISHLDRQVHSIHCSFIPGMGAELGESGCRTVMLSPYSSMFRASMWGGLPISLLALAVFAYLVMKAGQMFLLKDVSKRETTFLVAGTLLPVLMSVIFAFIAVNKVGAVCKLCVGVYLASAITFAGALLAHLKAPESPTHEPPTGLWARWFGEGVLYVAVLAIFYVMLAPSSPKSAQGCGTLVKRDDGSGLLIPLGHGKGTPSIAVVDPLCPACKGFDDRMRASDLYDKLSLQAALFPLDAECNWMVKESLHHGACAVSEAMLCDKENAEEILDFAFANQEELRNMAKQDGAKLRSRLEEKFPKVKGCLGSSKVKNQVNRSLRWAVSNALPVLTPQLFIGDRRVCDEDTDLGLEYTVSRMIDSAGEKKAKR